MTVLFMKKTNTGIHAQCPIRNVLDRISDRWSLLILKSLEPKTLRFSEIKKNIDDISQRMLSKTLRQLEEDGLLFRTIHAEVPPRVDYTLTDLGRSLLVPMSSLIKWANEHHGAIKEAREKYQERL
jgi:DNA-binding HxlR family transcriptional regulator